MANPVIPQLTRPATDAHPKGLLAIRVEPPGGSSARRRPHAPPKRAMPGLLEATALRLTEAAAPGDPAAGRRFLAAARTHQIALDHLWAVVDGDADPTKSTPTVIEACLAIPGHGRTLMLFTSVPSSDAGIAALALGLEAACQDNHGARIAQALLLDHEAMVRRAMLEAGFRELAELAYLRRPMPPKGLPHTATTPLPDGVELIPWTALKPNQRDAKFIAALSDSYIDTLDCPELCEVRAPEDVLESHRATGEFDGNLWTLILHHNKPAGAILLNPNPDQDAVELAYLGIGPSLRGKGAGKTLMIGALASLVGRHEQWVTCAVDMRNTPARRLYSGLGFSETARRTALIRVIDQPRATDTN